MLDDLRDESSSSPFYDEEFPDFFEDEKTPSHPQTAGRFLGMTPAQRFIIAVMLLVSVCVLGTMCLLVSGRIGIF
jgi:hypothetical protein